MTFTGRRGTGDWWVHRSSRIVRRVRALRGASLAVRRDAQELVGDDPEADPALHASRAMVEAAVEAVPAFQHTDAVDVI